MWEVLFTVVLCLGLAVAAIGLVTRVTPRRISGVRFRETDAEHAFFIVLNFSQGIYESQFGYPTGFFIVDQEKSVIGQKLRIEEARPAGSVTDGCSEAIGSLASAGFAAGGLYGCLWFMAVCIIGAPFFLISGLDRFYQFCLKSRIEVTFTRSGDDAVAQMAFYGASGYLVAPRYRHAFDEPMKPVPGGAAS